MPAQKPRVRRAGSRKRLRGARGGVHPYVAALNGADLAGVVAVGAAVGGDDLHIATLLLVDDHPLDHVAVVQIEDVIGLLLGRGACRHKGQQGQTE